jgi:hypothetical protein
MTYDCSCDFDAPSFYRKAFRRAAKQHRCEECSGPILRGEKYEYVTGKWDGYVNDFKTCERCHDLRQWVKNNVPCHCIMHGNQDEQNEEAINEAYYRARDEVRGLRFGYLRRKVLRDRHNDAARRESL